MAKKIALSLALVLIVASGAFAQTNWASGELSLLGVGARYEYMLNPQLSVGGNIYWSNLFIVFNEVEIGGSGRYYLWGQEKMFFVGGGLGFHIQTGTYDYKYDYTYEAYNIDTGEDETITEEMSGSWFGSVTGVAITLEAGWKIDVGNSGGFFVQPGVKIPFTFGGLNVDGVDVKNKFRVRMGFIPYCGLGYAF